MRILTSNPGRVYAYARVSGKSKFLIALNFGRRAFNGSLDVSSFVPAASVRITLTDVFAKKITTLAFPSSKKIPIKIPPMGFRVLQVK